MAQSEYLTKQYADAGMKLREALLTISPVLDKFMAADFSEVELDEKNVQALDFIKNQTTNITMLQLMLEIVIPRKEESS